MEGILKCGQLQRLGLTTKVGGYLAIGRKVVERLDFNTYDDMLARYTELLQECKNCFDNYVVGKYNIHAFTIIAT